MFRNEHFPRYDLHNRIGWQVQKFLSVLRNRVPDDSLLRRGHPLDIVQSTISPRVPPLPCSSIITLAYFASSYSQSLRGGANFRDPGMRRNDRGGGREGGSANCEECVGNCARRDSNLCRNFVPRRFESQVTLQS